MDSKTRIQAALAHQPTDRIPRYEIFLDGYKTAFRKHYSLSAEYDLYDWYGRIDIGTILADQRGPFYRQEKQLSDDGNATISLDSWGRRLYLSRSAFFERVLGSILVNKNDLDNLIFDNPASPDKYLHFAEALSAVSRRFAPVSGILGLFMGSYRMRGELDYLVDLAEDPGFCRALCGRLAEFLTITGLELAKATKTFDTAIWIYDEFSSTQGPLFSPQIFAAVFHPFYKKMIATWRSAGIKHVILHCDGNCLPLLDMLLDAGFDGLQGVAPSTGMWLPDIKRQYGNRLVLIGGMDNIFTLPQGSKADIIRQTDAMIETARDGGVILGTHSIDGDVPVENYDAYSLHLDDHDSLAM